MGDSQQQRSAESSHLGVFLLFGVLAAGGWFAVATYGQSDGLFGGLQQLEFIGLSLFVVLLLGTLVFSVVALVLAAGMIRSQIRRGR